MDNKLADKVIVIGLGYVGLPLAISAAQQGFHVIGFDTDINKINNLRVGQISSSIVDIELLINLQDSGKLVLTNKLEKQTEPVIFVIAVPTPLDLSRKPDLSMLMEACETVGEIISSDSLVINESTSYIGTLRNLIKPIIDKKSGQSRIKFAVAPERIDPGNSSWNIGNTPRLISGLTAESTTEALSFYSKICSEALRIDEPEVAEAAKLFENSFRLVNIALVMSLSRLAHRYGITANEIITAASTKPFGFVPFFPGVGVGGHCIPVDPIYLSHSADSVGLDLEIVNAAFRVNEHSINEVIQLIKINYFQNLKDVRVQIAGISYKINSSDLRESKSVELMHALRKQGANVIWHDPLVSEVNHEQSQKLTEKIDIGLILVPHTCIDFKPWLNSKVLVLDFSSTPVNFGWKKVL